MTASCCEIEDFVEIHLCKLRGILQSRVLRTYGFWGEQNLTKSDNIRQNLTTSDNIRQILTKSDSSCRTEGGGRHIIFGLLPVYVCMYMKCVYGYSKADVYFSQHLFIPMFWDINAWCGYDEENRANKLATKKKQRFLCFPSLPLVDSSAATLACAPSHQAITKCKDCQGMAAHQR